MYIYYVQKYILFFRPLTENLSLTKELVIFTKEQYCLSFSNVFKNSFSKKK